MLAIIKRELGAPLSASEDIEGRHVQSVYTSVQEPEEKKKADVKFKPVEACNITGVVRIIRTLPDKADGAPTAPNFDFLRDLLKYLEHRKVKMVAQALCVPMGRFDGSLIVEEPESVPLCDVIHETITTPAATFTLRPTVMSVGGEDSEDDSE